MGVEYRAVILVGLPYKDLPEDFQDYDFLEDNDLSVISPYFDADHESCLVGFVIEQADDYSWTELDNVGDMIAARNIKANEFESIIGMKPKVYLTTYGW